MYKGINMENYKALELLKAVANETRLSIINLVKDKELSVNEIACSLEMSQTAISHQLKILKNLNIIKGSRKGKHIYYTISDHHIKNMIAQVYEHVNH